MKAAGSRFGTVLFDGTGQAIYVFDKATTPRARCYEACTKPGRRSRWQDIQVQSVPCGPGLLGTTRRRGGSAQATYAGRALYVYAH